MELATIFVGLGTIVAAFVTGIFSFTSILIAKDQKTSEFRQDWINRVRDDVAKFTYAVGDFTSHLVAKKGDQKAVDDFVNNNMALTNEITRSYNSLRLHLNSVDDKKILKILSEHYSFAERTSIDYTVDDVSAMEDLLIEQVQLMLKSEWTRVKRGETTYRVMKWFGFILIISSISCLVFYFPMLSSIFVQK